MAYLAPVNGATQAFGSFGRTVQVLNCAATNMTQAQIEVLIASVSLTNSISGISAYVAGTTDVLYVAVEGPTYGDATVGAFTVTTLCTFTSGQGV
jgi:hypothetical protein